MPKQRHGRLTFGDDVAKYRAKRDGTNLKAHAAVKSTHTFTVTDTK
jgi:hypothetical protein